MQKYAVICGKRPVSSHTRHRASAPQIGAYYGVLSPCRKEKGGYAYYVCVPRQQTVRYRVSFGLTAWFGIWSQVKAGLTTKLLLKSGGRSSVCTTVFSASDRVKKNKRRAAIPCETLTWCSQPLLCLYKCFQKCQQAVGLVFYDGSRSPSSRSRMWVSETPDIWDDL